jgi:hypothetical protein
VDLAGQTPRICLRDPEDCQRFHVAAVGGSADELRIVLSRSGVGEVLTSGDALIDVAAVARLAGGLVVADWADRFQGMLAYARTKGWLEDSGITRIRAHVEWLA